MLQFRKKFFWFEAGQKKGEGGVNVSMWTSNIRKNGGFLFWRHGRVVMVLVGVVISFL